LARKELQRLQKEAKELSIQLVGDSRMNHLEERGNDTIQVRSNSDFEVKCATIQFYRNSYNSQSDRWIGLKFYVESPDMFSYFALKLKVRRSLRRLHDSGQQRLYEFCYLLSFDLWTFYLARILFLQGYDSLFWESSSSTRIFNGMQHSFQVWQGFINVSESSYYKDSLFIIATIRKKEFGINSTFRSDFLVYLGLLKGDKSDSLIFMILIFVFLLFSTWSLGCYHLFGSIVSGLHIRVH
jgi:hypothetical protein